MSTATKEAPEGITVGMFSGGERHFETPEDLIDAGREEVRRCGGIFPPDSARIVAACWPYVRERTPTGSVDVRLSEAAGNFHVGEPPPRPETPFDEELEEAAAEEARLKAAWQEGQDKLQKKCRDVDMLNGRGHIHLQGGTMVVYAGEPRDVPRPNPGHVREAMDEAEAAAKELDRLEEEMKEARREANELRQKQTRWRAHRSG